MPTRTPQVLAQMEGSGRGALGSYNADQYAVLMEHLEAFPMRDGDDWLEALMIKNKMLGVRIAEVRLEAQPAQQTPLPAMFLSRVRQ